GEGGGRGEGVGVVWGRKRGGAAPPFRGVAGRPSDVDIAATNATIPDQPWHVAAVLAGDVEPAGWWGPGRAASWADAVEAARVVLAESGTGAEEAEIRAGAVAPRHPRRCAAL